MPMPPVLLRTGLAVFFFVWYLDNGLEEGGDGKAGKADGSRSICFSSVR